MSPRLHKSLIALDLAWCLGVTAWAVWSRPPNPYDPDAYLQSLPSIRERINKLEDRINALEEIATNPKER